jgi:hypothetical protein
MRRYGAVVGVGLLVLAGCGSGGGATPTPAPGGTTPAAPAGLDLAVVRANFTDECKSPIIVDDLFCTQVKIDGMAAEGTSLIVPTTLNAAATARASAICEQAARAHYDGATGNDLGYTTVSVLDKDGGNATVCPVP